MRHPRHLGEILVLRGALFGLVVYSVYDFTNLSTLKGWPLWLTRSTWPGAQPPSAGAAWIVGYVGRSAP